MLVIVLSPAAEGGGGGLRLLAVPGPWGEVLNLDAGIDASPPAEVGTGTRLAIQQARLGLINRLIGGDRNTLLLELTADRFRLDADDRIRFPASGTRLPGELTGLELGFTGRHIDPAGRRWVLSVGARSRSDELVDDERAIVYQSTAAVFLPGSDGEGWTLGLSYVSTLDYPLPLILYTWVPDPSVRAVIGLPFQFLSWTPAPQWRLSLRNFGLSPAAELRFSPDRHWHLAAHIGRHGWKGRIADRHDPDLELELESWRLGLGLEYVIAPGRRVRLDLGWEFERELVQSESGDLFDGEDDEEHLDLDDAPYLRLGAGWGF